MKQIFKDVTRSVARGVFGVDISAVGTTFATAPTYTEEIRSLLDALSPVVCEHALIRLGPNGDGGYLVPDDLEGIAACFSPGVSSVSGFELACAQRGMRVYMADKSVDEPAEKHPQFHFQKKYIGATTNSDFATLDHWISESIASTEDDDLILQMDIEGYEYETLLAVSDDLLRRFRIIVVEFHNLHQLCNEPFFRLASPAFFKLLQTHKCLHIHPNNSSDSVRYGELTFPPVMEFTFLRNDRVREMRPATSFPHVLDYDNTSNPPLVLPDCWHRAPLY